MTHHYSPSIHNDITSSSIIPFWVGVEVETRKKRVVLVAAFRNHTMRKSQNDAYLVWPFVERKAEMSTQTDERVRNETGYIMQKSKLTRETKPTPSHPRWLHKNAHPIDHRSSNPKSDETKMYQILIPIRCEQQRYIEEANVSCQR